MTKPYLLIDVDGPLNPYAQSNRQLRIAKVFHEYKLLGYKVWLHRWHGEQLLALADEFELTWCTTWEGDANMLIGPKIGLPDLPVITFDSLRAQPPAPGLYWKTAAVLAYCAGRPFAWIDDEISVLDDQYVADHHDRPALLRKIDPATGLNQQDFDALASWAASLKEVTTTETGGT